MTVKVDIKLVSALQGIKIILILLGLTFLIGKNRLHCTIFLGIHLPLQTCKISLPTVNSKSKEKQRKAHRLRELDNLWWGTIIQYNSVGAHGRPFVYFQVLGIHTLLYARISQVLNTCWPETNYWENALYKTACVSGKRIMRGKFLVSNVFTEQEKRGRNDHIMSPFISLNLIAEPQERPNGIA